MPQTLQQIMDMIVEKYGQDIEVVFNPDLSGRIDNGRTGNTMFEWFSFSDLIINLLP